ncbi:MULTISPECIES: metallophosphoesterase [Polaromonas]|uniref:Metallophosphoesterase n=1 Tax=Polaromonas aquatica TaxID=332657 RepID=A0ABW1TZ96_9BURK
MNFYPILLLMALLHAYVGWRVLPGLGAYPQGQVLLLVVLVLSTLLMPLGLLGSRVVRQPWADRLSWVGLLLMGLFSSLFVLTLLRDVALLLLWLADALTPLALPLAQWRTASAEVVPVLALLVTLLGFLNARRTPAVVRVDVPIRGLPSALQGFTVAQISDIHVGPTIKGAYLQRIVNRVNGLRADMVAITGDLVDGKVAELAGHVAPLAGLKSRHGTFFVTGNHEYYSGAHAWVAELRRLGLTVLMNEHVVLHHGKAAHTALTPLGDPQEDEHIMAPLVLAGVTDYSAHHFDEAHRSDPQTALEGSPLAASVRLLLAHQPRSAAAAARAGFDLQLSGHTHGGQFYPWNLFVRFQQPFTNGLHKLQNLWVYTSRGTGYWGPPKRFGAPSEITQLRLVAG